MYKPPLTQYLCVAIWLFVLREDGTFGPKHAVNNPPSTYHLKGHLH